VLQLLDRYRHELKGIDCRVFRNKQEAVRWLDVSVEQRERTLNRADPLSDTNDPPRQDTA
jgi:hypothetical protein